MKSIRLFALLLSSIAFSANSNASVVNQFISIDQSGSVVSVVNKAIQPFDTSLGELEAVRINFNGTLSVSGIYTSNLRGDLVPAPVPYSFKAKVDQAFYGEAGLSGFGFDTPASYVFSAVAVGTIGESYLLQKSFNFDFTFDDISDLLGFALPASVSGPNTPPTQINGLTDTFENSNLLLLSRLITTDLSGMPNTPVTSMHALLSVTYDYTPNQPGNDVPEPTTAALLAISLLGLAASSRKARLH